MNKELLRQRGFDKEVDLVEKGLCPFCEKSIVMDEFRNDISRKEYEISGLCQKCQDKIFGED